MRIRKLFFGCSFLLMSGTVGAQCATGMVNAPGCPPPDHPAISGGSNQSVSLPPVQWADRWGAIATDGKGVTGAVTDLASKGQAKAAAIDECLRRGGGSCVVKAEYKNQCAAIIAGNSGSDIVNAPTIDRAKEIGMNNCKAAGNSSCWVYYSGCSLPQRIQ